MSSDPSAPLPTPTNYQRTTGGGHLRWQPPTPEHLQEMLPAYEVLSILGQGGMGAVYKGRQKSLDRIVAIKILPPEAGEDDMQFVERFKNEARTMAKMNHPAIVHVYDFGETTEGQLYIVMEFIDGTDVAKMIQSQGKLPEDYALSITAHVCDALGYAHTQGVVHRDIKPANVLINMEGQVKVADFGLAKATDPSQMGLTKTNMAMGTPDFVSPEALMPGVPLDGRADLYAVGVMLFNMLTGSIPRGAFRMPSVTLKTDARFDKIIGKAMEMDRENRYQTALDLRRDLDVILTTPAAKTGMQTIPAQAAQPQKPMGKSPSAPQGKEGSAGTLARSVPTADKSVRAPIAPVKKSNAVMIYGIAAAVVVAGGAFMLSSGGKKPVTAPKAVAESKPEPKKPDSKPAAPPSAASKPKPAESKPAPAPAAVAAGNEKWVDGLAQWFGAKHTPEADKAVVRDGTGGARVGAGYNTLAPVSPSTPAFRDQVARVRARLPANKDEGDLRLFVRLATNGGRKEYVLLPRIWEKRFRLVYDDSSAGAVLSVLGDFPLPAGFDSAAVHSLELRVVGDLLTAALDGKKLGEIRDGRFVAGHPAIFANNITIESFEYANLDPGGSAPALAAAKPSPASPVEPALTNTLGMKFVPVPITGGPTGGQLVLFSVWDTRVQDYAVFATETKREWKKPDFEQDPTHPVVAVNWEDAQAFCAWLTARERKAGKLGANEHYRLPTDHEWSCAVGIGDQEDAAKLPSEKSAKLNDVYPWGTQWPPPAGAGNYPGEESRSALAGGNYANNVLAGYDDGFVHTSPVGSFAANRLGLYDLSGNVLQWCEDWFDASQKDRVMRGAAWMYFSRSGLLSSGRGPVPPGGVNRVYGFRCVLAGSVATAAAPPAATADARDGWQDALALVDLSRDDPNGEWKRDGHSLKMFSGSNKLCAIPIQPSPSYDLRVRVRREGEPSAVSIGFTKAGRTGFFSLDANPLKTEGPLAAGLEMLKGKYANQSGEAVERPQWLSDGSLHEIILQVRDEGLVASLDGEEIYRWKGDWADVGPLPSRWQNEKGFAVGGWRGKMTFEDISWRPVVEDAGRKLAAASTPAVAPTMPAAAPAPAPAAPVAPADPRLAQLAAGFKARHEADALQPFNTALAALNTSYLANGVSRARTAAKAKGSLAEVTALDAEKTAIEQGRGVPDENDSDTAESLKTLRATYRSAHAKFAAERDAKAAPLYDLYLKALDAYIAELTQADKIDAARKVQVFRDDIALQKPAAGAAATPASGKAATTAPAPSAAAKPAVRAPKLNEREVAEWAIATGGFVDASFGTPPVTKRIAIASELPRGRFIMTAMTVNCDKVPGKDLSPLASAQDVGQLTLENSLLPDKTSLDLTPLRQMPELRTLTTRDLDAAAVDGISSLDELEALYTENMPEGSIEKFGKLKRLVHFGSRRITGPGIAALKSCKNLHDLRSGECSDADVRALAAAWPDLDYLLVGGPALTNASIPFLLSLKSLKILTLDSDELDDSVLEPLGKLPNLATLRLYSSKFTGSNLAVLKKFSSLTTLILDGCSVTDEALDVLVQIKSLTKLQFRDTKVTDAGIAKFKAARPGFNISK